VVFEYVLPAEVYWGVDEVILKQYWRVSTVILNKSPISTMLFLKYIFNSNRWENGKYNSSS
jgi:hypothetical protein